MTRNEKSQFSDGGYLGSEGEMGVPQLGGGPTDAYVILYKLSYLKYFKISF